MRLEALLATLWAGVVAALTISHMDLESGIRPCDDRVNCSESGEESKKWISWLYRNCQCDKECARYGDCCPASPNFVHQEQRRGLATYDCVELREFVGVYMVTSCPPEWSGPSVRASCEATAKDKRDPLAGIPATDVSTGVTYRNLFCAICHRAQELDVWHPRIECPTVPPNTTLSPGNYSDLHFDEERGLWGFRINDDFHGCTIDPSVPEASDKLIRRCVPNLIKTCAVNWTNAEVRSRCDGYTSLVFEGGNVYRNLYCGVCNNVPLQMLQCATVSTRFYFPFKHSAFAILFDLSGGPPGKEQPCLDHQLYDPFFKRCRNVLEEFQEQLTPVAQPTMPRTINISFDNNDHINDRNNDNNSIEKCSKFLLEKDDFVAVNNTVYVSRYRRRFLEGEFNIRRDGKLEICSSIGEIYVEKFDKYMGYVTFAGLGVSMIFIFLHLTAFCLVEELRNLSGKNLASLCLTLLIAYTSFMTGQFLSGGPCFVAAVVTFYAFLASFFWMLTMAFDVWRTLRLATSELRVSAGKQWRKFLLYSAWSWAAPAAIVALALWAEMSPDVDADWRPAFGATNSCWFGRSKPLLVFFAVPLAVVMLLNIVFFASSAHMVYSSSSTTRFTASAGTQRDFRLYLRLAVLLGFTWIMGLVAGSLDIDLLWYLFILLNTLQGFFIFLAFTCNDKVIRGLALHRDTRPEVIPRSFSWSTDSIARKSNVESEKTMDTLY